VTAEDDHDRLEHLRREAQRAREVSPVHAHLLAHLIDRGELLAALGQFSQARQLPARSADAHEALAFYARRLGLHEISNAHYRAATNLAPDDPQAWHNLATSERSLGRMQEAVDACNRALRIGGDPFPTLLLRSECRRATAAENKIDELAPLLDRARTVRERMFIGYALGKELHDLGNYDRAFSAFAAGAQARRANLAYDVAEDQRKIARIIEAFAAPASPEPLGTNPAEQIFIIGLPRSGTTLAERILLGLEGVGSNGETDNVLHALIHAAPATGGDVFNRFARADPEKFAERYRALCNPHGAAITFIEKLPLNYLYAGAIAPGLKRARIIWINRHSVDSCFAMWRTLFAQAYPFSYDFEELAAYRSAYDGLKAHWQRMIGEFILDVDYEELVYDPAGTGRRMAEHCGLKWKDAATDIGAVGTASLTASATQIREGIYTHASGVWRHYANHLAPLVGAIERHAWPAARSP
jgi:tetratricopeptide (TPR) repeat protein